MLRRPSLSVVSAILSPRPSSPIRFSTGTVTFVNSSTPFAIALSPMKWQRCTTSTPAQSASTTNAEIFPFASPSACFAITTRSFAIVPFVHQSFVPFST
jgi:hypothetical protein